MEILQVLALTLGSIASWYVGWHFHDWMKWLFSLRVSATDTHLVIEVDTNAVKKKLDSINQPSIYVPPPKPPTSITPQDVYNQLWDYYEEGHQKQLAVIDRILSDKPIFSDYLHQRRSQNNLATDIEELYSCCSDCDGDKQYADNIKYLNIRSECVCE